VNVAAAAPSATAEPDSLKTMSGSANCVTLLPKFEIVSPTKNFPKSDLSRLPHHRGTMSSSCVRVHLVCFVRHVIHDAFVCVVQRPLRS